MNAFVGTKTVDSAEALRSQLDALQAENGYYFLRWPHRVSGIQAGLPADFSSPEGQWFSRDRELRWQQVGPHFSLLLLCTEGALTGDELSDFAPVGNGNWQTQDRQAHFYPKTETRFPKGLHYPTALDIGQRYFLDAQTATVRFVALTVRGE